IVLTKILGGVLTNKTRAGLKESTIKNYLNELGSFKSLDIGCAVENKSFYVDYHKDDSVFTVDRTEVLTHKKNNDLIKEFYKSREIKNIEFSKKNNSLVTFFLQLTRYLQQSIGTVAAIDLHEYAKAINFEIDEDV